MKLRIQFLFGTLLVTLLFLVGCAARQAMTLPDARDQYQLAMREYEEKSYDQAILEFQKVLFNYPGLSYVDSAQYWFAMSYYGREDFHLGVAEFRRIITNFPNSELLDDAQYMIGKSYFEASPGNVGLDQSDNENAISELTAFLEDYPVSERRIEGEGLLSSAIEKRIAKEFKAARQYFKMGNRASSRIYLEDLIKEYPESKFTPEALYLLARVDEKESKLTDARDKLSNLINAFPDSEFAPKAEKLREKINTLLALNSQPAADSLHDSLKVTEKKSE